LGIFFDPADVAALTGQNRKCGGEADPCYAPVPSRAVAILPTDTAVNGLDAGHTDILQRLADIRRAYLISMISDVMAAITLRRDDRDRL
jgi:hypothetical protein